MTVGGIGYWREAEGLAGTTKQKENGAETVVTSADRGSLHQQPKGLSNVGSCRLGCKLPGNYPIW
jgi:hypothetical protein